MKVFDAFKSIGRVIAAPFKAVGKLISKGFNKLGKFMNKFGIVGQMGMMFITGGISSAMFQSLSTFGGGFMQGLSVGGNLSQTAHKILSGFARVAKIPGNAIGTTAKETFGTITDAVVGTVGDTYNLLDKALPLPFGGPSKFNNFGEFANSVSTRVFPLFKGYVNRINMYPIMSPSVLSIQIKFKNGDESLSSKAIELHSPSEQSISIDVEEMRKEFGLTDVTAFEVIASAISGKVPTRVNHQLVYGSYQSALKSSINVSLSNNEIFLSPRKRGLAWGQMVFDENYESYIGICFGSGDDEEEIVEINFYGNGGFVKTFSQLLKPCESIILQSSDLSSIGNVGKFVWYFVNSQRADLTVFSFHFHKNSFNASGEHSF